MDKEDKPSKESCRRYKLITSISNNDHKNQILVSIMLLISHHPEYLQQHQFKRLILRPGGCHFFYAFGITVSLGFYSMVLCLYLSKKVLDVKAGDLKL